MAVEPTARTQNQVADEPVCVLYYQNRWGLKPLSLLSEEEAVILTIRLLETASEFDSATGGVNQEARLYPLIKLVTSDGVREISKTDMESLYTQKVAAGTGNGVKNV